MSIAPANIASGKCGTCNWEIDSEGVLTLYTGTLDTWTSSTVPWRSYRSQITSAKINGTVIAQTCTHMFADCESMVSADLVNLDVSNVTDMSFMFYGCESLESLDVSEFDTSKVRNMLAIFLLCGAPSFFLDIYNWDTRAVTNSDAMFADPMVGLGDDDIQGYLIFSGAGIRTGENWRINTLLPPSNLDLSETYTWHRYTDFEPSINQCFRCDSTGSPKRDGGMYVLIESSLEPTLPYQVTKTNSLFGYIYIRDDLKDSLSATTDATLTDQSTLSVFTDSFPVDTPTVIQVNSGGLEVLLEIRLGTVMKSLSSNVPPSTSPAFSAHKSNGVVDGIGIGASYKAGYINDGLPHAMLGEAYYPTFTRSSWSASSDVSTLPTTPCFVLSLSDFSLWYCDASDQTTPISRVTPELPLSIANGGTGANTAAGALAALGGFAYSDNAPSSIDLNNLTEGGSYAVYISYTTNYPPTSHNFGTVYVSTYGEDVFRVHQLLIASGASGGDNFEVWVRSSYHDNGSRAWGSWIQLSKSGHTHSYLPLSGGTLTGQLNIRRGSTSYVAGATSCGIYQPHNNANEWFPALSMRTKSQGAWSIGCYDSDNLQFVFNSASNISSGTNSPATVNLPATGGTLALTSHTHSYLPLSGGTLTGRLAINANGVKSWFGSANNGWVHFSNDQGKSNYFEQSIHCAGDFFIYNAGRVMLRTETDGNSRVNYISGYDYLHITTWQKGNYGVTWWSSDIRLKENIADSEVDALEVVNQIQHRSFDMKSDGEHHDIGYIAQELEKLDPQMVTKVYQSREVNGRSYFTGDYTYQIDERKVIPYLSKSIQQLSEENEQLKAKNAELEKRLAAIEERLGL